MKTDTSKSLFAFFDFSVYDFYLMHLQVTSKLCCFFFSFNFVFIFILYLELWLFLRYFLLAFVCVMCCCCIKVEIFGAIFRKDSNFVPWGYKVEFLSLSRHLLDIFVNFYKSINKLLYGSFLAVFLGGCYIFNMFLDHLEIWRSLKVFFVWLSLS